MFFGLAIAAGPLGGLTLDDTARAFVQGAEDIAYAALIVGLARGTLVVLRDARVIDTITHAMPGALRGLPSTLSAVGIYIVQNLLHFVVPSGSGLRRFHAGPGPARRPSASHGRPTSWPISSERPDQCLHPTQGYFMAALGILRIPWTKWVRWLLPLLGSGSSSAAPRSSWPASSA